MQTEIIIAGFGGQGVLFAGQLLAYAAMDTGLNVTWIPSYGPEMRGGTANCTVVISDEEIGSPNVHNPQVLLAMNQPSLDKYEKLVRPGGLIVLNASIIARAIQRQDVRVASTPANEIAEKAGDKRMTNMVMLGCLLANTAILPVEAIEKALESHLPQRHHRLLPANFQALRQGAAFLAEAVPV
jgi:2-oxoglutarate ferredoxin oxidoreductase subunit gamma